MGLEVQTDLKQNLMVVGLPNLANNQHLTGQVRRVSSLANYPEGAVDPKQFTKWPNEQTAPFPIKTHGLQFDF